MEKGEIGNYNHSEFLQNIEKNLMEIDKDDQVVYCEGHNVSTKQIAVRYCRFCNMCVCNDCAIENHYEHIAEAKFKLADILGLGGKESWKILKNEIESNIDKSPIGRVISDNLTAVNKETRNLINEVEFSVDSIKGKLDGLNELIKEYNDFTKNSLNETRYEANSSSFKELNETKIWISRRFSEWDALSNNQKVYLTKLKKPIEQRISNKVESLYKEPVTNIIKEFIRHEDQKEINKLKTELGNVESHLVDINSHVKSWISKYIPPIPEPDPIPVRPYLLGLKAKTAEVAIIPLKNTPDTEIRLIKITPDIFTDHYSFSIFPLDHSRYVNLHDSILVTGGMEKGFSYENCYSVTVSNIDNKYSVTISSYAPMIEKRERHNIIYIEHLNSVLACSGFYTKTCEINSLNSSGWSYISEMKDYRANATMFCANDRYVYCVGGFKVTDREKPQGGSYLNSLEYIDSYDLNKGWTNVELSSLNSSLRLCAMGVINLSNNRILLVGGYDGAKYLTEINECLFEKEGIISSINMNRRSCELGKGVIFTSNQVFSKTSYNMMLNFDSNCKLIRYENNSQEFSIRG